MTHPLKEVNTNQVQTPSSLTVVSSFAVLQGGMKAVLWTDTVQVIIMFCAMIAVVLKGTFDVGGFGPVWEISKEGGRIEFDK